MPNKWFPKKAEKHGHESTRLRGALPSPVHHGSTDDTTRQCVQDSVYVSVGTMQMFWEDTSL